ncbi:hypothetical protein IEQ34_004742 [Dendrobium chrysotoxum]|uniref:Protein PHLOEM PROTEIN 2-LIKE A10 n=1 Tax=Dendrobium chrysotoxum TaxID=161865 RepID=A0AAV7H158_DENCH|nr:hypothetical protein IEQ34_004742 [Dendrobium chrysotoxum]
MTAGLTQTLLSFSPRRRRWILLLAAAGLSSYGAYKVYHLPSVSSKRRNLVKFVRDLVSIAEAISSAADAVSVVSCDLNRFLQSDSDEIPTSLKQVAKIARSDELSSSISRVSEALTVGIIRGMGSASDSQGFSDRLLEKLFSSNGSGFASVMVGSFARNLVMAFYSGGDGMDSSYTPRWVNLMCEEKCRELIAESIQHFVGTAVAVYLEKTMEVNTYDELFSGLTNPRHEAQVKDVLVSVCNGAVETLVKTSHEVLTSTNSISSIDIGTDVSQARSPQNLKGFSDFMSKEGSGWVERVSSVLAIPSNKKFVLDVTGRLTFESVRSFLEFLLWKLEDGVKRGVNVVHEEVIVRSLDVVRFLSAKVMLSFSLCFAICMRFAAGPRVLMAA